MHCPSVASWHRHLGPQSDNVRAPLGVSSLPAAIAETARRHPSAAALTVGATTVTHAEVADRAARIAGGLLERGLSSADRVLLAGPASINWVCAYLAVLWAGGTAVPVDVSLRDAELTRIVDDATPRFAMAAGEAARLAGWDLPWQLFSLDDGPDARSLANLGRHTPIAPDVQATAPAMLAYTSGTTGAPKAVPLGHANVQASICGAMLAWRWSSGDTLVHSLPLSHQHGLSAVHASLLAGSHTIILEQFDPDRLLATIRSAGATVLFAVPAIYERLNRLHAGPPLDLRLAISGSAALPRRLSEEVANWLGQVPLERYGSTEAGLILSNLYNGPRFPGFVGFALPGAEVRILGAGEASAAPGEEGEIVARGPQVFGGYLHDRDNAGAFTSDGWFRMGDLGVEDPSTGAIAVTGRIKDIIITGGLNVAPAEVELVLDEHPEIAGSVVVGIPSEKWGEEIVALVVQAGRNLDADGVLEWVRARLAPYKCPKRIVVVDQLPRNRLGKVQRPEARDIATRRLGIGGLLRGVSQ